MPILLVRNSYCVPISLETFLRLGEIGATIVAPAPRYADRNSVLEIWSAGDDTAVIKIRQPDVLGVVQPVLTTWG